MLTHWEETRTVIKRLAFVNTPKLWDYNYKIDKLGVCSRYTAAVTRVHTPARTHTHAHGHTPARARTPTHERTLC